MNGFKVWIGASLVAASVANSGCGFQRPPAKQCEEPSYYQAQATKIDYPDVETPINDQLLATRAPLSVLDENDIQFDYLTLQDAVRTALQNSKVMRDLGGVILRAPGSAVSTYDVALQELDPRFGVAAALSEFDTNFSSATYFEKNDKAINNQFAGGGTRQFNQDFLSAQGQLAKRAATGTQFAARTSVEYDSNNAPGNQFGSAYTSIAEIQARHPLLRGGGSEFLRIAGPGNVPGVMTGVVLARINTDVSLAQFEGSVRDFVSNVENAYWDLYFAYRDLDAKIVARNTSLQTWNSINALYQASRVGGEAEKEAQAREQYYRFQDQVQNALSGKLSDPTQTNNGSGGGTFRGTGGVMTAERRLRLIMGVPINDGKLFRTADEPIEAKVVFDWDSSLVEALQRRPELRRQKWIIKRREKELIASRNFLLPQLDLIGRYRFRGFGKDFLAQGADIGEFDNSVGDLFNGNFQESQVGVEFSVPLGRRRAHAAQQYAEMQLARDRVLLAEQERDVVHQLSDSVSDMNRAYAVMETNEDRRIAAAEQLEAVRAAYEADKASLDLLLRTQQAFLDAEQNYYRSLCEYTIAIRNVHYEKGSLLDYNEIYLTEDLWPMRAYQDAKERDRLKVPSEWLDNLVNREEPVTQGEYQQNVPAAGERAIYAEPVPEGGRQAPYDETPKPQPEQAGFLQRLDEEEEAGVMAAEEFGGSVEQTVFTESDESSPAMLPDDEPEPELPVTE